LRLINRENKLEIIIEDELLNRLGEIAINHFPNEFGGFLIGYYSDDFKTLFLIDYILPKKYKSSPVIFERSVEGIESDFERFFNERKIYYVGEWHSHPNGSTKNSGTDLNAMINTVACETVQIKNPILLILSVSKTKMMNYTFYYYEDNRLTPYEQN
jgi:[CysO sulfur-carrier protein]-S-L-cysteine hydrolase